MMRCRPVVAGGLALLAFAGSAAAQEVPSTVDPGRIEQRLEEQPAPRAEPVEIPEPRDDLTPEETDAIRFRLVDVIFDGNTVLTDDGLRALAGGLIGRDISLTDLRNLAEEVTVAYSNAGYILSRAVVPAQTVDGGVATIRVVEGFVNRVIVEGDLRGREALFDAYARKIEAARPLNIETLERYTLLANDLPGTSVQARVRPSQDTPGAADIVLTVEHTLVDGSVSVDNRGGEASGPWEVVATVGANSLLGLYERTELLLLTTTNTNELRYVALGQEHTLTSEGTTLGIRANHSRSEPGGDLKQFDISSRNTTLRTELEHPFIRSRNENLSMRLEGVWRNSESEQFDSSTLSEDRIRKLTVGVTYDIADEWAGVNLIDVSLHQGLDILDATDINDPDKTRDRGRADFTKIEVIAQRTQGLPHGFAVQGLLTGQYAFTQLLASEEYGYGGGRIGRAYDSSEIVGDNGVSGLLELNYTRSFEGQLFDYIQPFASYDIGMVHDRAVGAGEDATRTGASAAIGLRFGLAEQIIGSAELTKPLTRIVAAEGDRDPRVFFSITGRF